ncbi:MAG: PepSY domain-containing protein [Gammaproteobacteria bacterium]|nr:PepSY domain-containing protein [Gammaproteobacteria bacterium]
MKIRGDILRTYQTLHTWTGITAGLLLFIGFFAGALTMFQSEIRQWATPPAHHLAQIKLEQFDSLIKQTLAQSPQAHQEFTINLTDQQSPITWFEQGKSRGLRLDDQLRQGTLDQQGNLVSELSAVNELTSLIDFLHRTAGIIGEIGHDHAGIYILGIAGIAYFLALVSGVIFLLPTLTKTFFALRDKKGPGRFWLDSHNLVGLTSLPYHVVISFTVVVFAFHDFLYGGLSVVYGEQPMFERHQAAVVYQLSELPPVAQQIQKALDFAPGFTVTSVHFTNIDTRQAMASFNMLNDQAMMRGPSTDSLWMDPFTLEIINSSYPQGDEGIWGRMVNTIFAIHFGSYGGDLGRWLYFIMGLGGAFLFYSGNLLWLEKRRKKQTTEQAKSTKIMAALTVGVCLGSMAGLAVCIMATKWLNLWSVNVNNYYMGLYYLTFFAVIAYAFTRGAAVAAIHCLQLLALSCLLIPTTSLIAMLWPDLGLWPWHNTAAMSVELVAGLFAIAFYMLARRTKLRATTGPANSLWHIPAARNDEITAQAALST